MRLDAAEVNKSLQRENSLYYKFYSPRFKLNVSARPVEPRVVVEQQTRLTFRDDELQLHSKLTYKIDRAGVFELQLQLPENLTVDRVISTAMKEYNVDKNSRKLLIVLNRKQQGTIPLTVTAHRGFEPDEQSNSQMLPLLEPIGVARETGRVFVFAPEAIEVTADEEKLVGAYPERAINVRAPANTRLTWAWIYNRRPIEIPIKTLRKPTRLTAKIGTTVNVKQELVEVSAKLVYLVEHAGIETFRFDVPEAVADNVLIRFLADEAAIKQKSRAENAIDGWVTWTVVMQQEVLGEQPFEIRYDLKPAAADGSNDVETTVPLIRVLGLESTEVQLSRVSGEVAVMKDHALSVSAEATSANSSCSPPMVTSPTATSGSRFSCSSSPPNTKSRKSSRRSFRGHWWRWLSAAKIRSRIAAGTGSPAANGSVCPSICLKGPNR